ncbi:hypothetical protein CcaverHIS002_0700770 [Cutaneotrichosporon cavernicola]|uniref:Clathrin/coatomer adaptor adaptin-like N-terminal domain-containing protein n=1 Tax=Cutaneotrichosporon cavernicola TaxID=279322 RepID=A0AA48L984_9TREE|nr:uncharacterized protein CcaverHIS019_0700780 [Cutaneotrichosporon cavernicola]BEI86731.1 hypothetical protein CcaverHIS002_0700770 [Cutaneotrichosporon cavernicola]BEI94506.1 hypothetical protein CcaverHIS019_0700780 [Cutaneotrichosporon cavernicola]BEJ02282.1 hypothetical protein CcaverHIS631_0700770 [Cutaneotrichosporon cavernicola]BEJ10041.1 hypothetical protein CcaverHIS641_0700760 [Cutaneotrichosporon cavernicola]
MVLPPFILSGANSRAHYTLLARLDAAESPQAAIAVVAAEAVRCRGVLEGKAGNSKTAETLIILLTCTTVSTIPLDTDFALVPALKLAESGKSHRRTGYRFLIERLPEGHELALMLINTVRKDLASSNPAHILMALGAICHLPSDELAPAVLPLLNERRLVEHELPAVRQRTIQALCALNGQLGLRELARRIRKEDDDSVLSSIVKSFGEALHAGAREENPEKRRRQFDTLFAAAARHLHPSPLLVQLMRAVACVLAPLGRGEDLTDHVLERAHALTDEIVEVTTTPGPWAQACLVEVCALAATIWAADSKPVSEPLLEHVRNLLLPEKEKGKERTPVHSARSSPRKPEGKSSKPHPNRRILGLRCLATLPFVWLDGLTETHMGALMAGVDSGDSTVRLETLRLLAKVDANLPRLTADSHLDSLSRGAEEKEDAASRALEALEVALEGEEPGTRAQGLAESLARITPHFTHVWMKGVHAAIGYTQILPPTSFIDPAADALLAAPADPTLAVAVATLAVEHDRPAVPALLAALPRVDPEVQELCILALVPLHGGQEAVRTLRKVAEGAIPHIRRRCEQVALVLEQGQAWDVVGRAKSRALTDVLDALLAVHAELVTPSRPSLEDRDSNLSASTIRSKPAALKYNYGTSSPLGRAAELAMGRSALVEPDDVALDELTADTGRVRI